MPLYLPSGDLDRREGTNEGRKTPADLGYYSETSHHICLFDVSSKTMTYNEAKIKSIEISWKTGPTPAALVLRRTSLVQGVPAC